MRKYLLVILFLSIGFGQPAYLPGEIPLKSMLNAGPLGGIVGSYLKPTPPYVVFDYIDAKKVYCGKVDYSVRKNFAGIHLHAKDGLWSHYHYNGTKSHEVTWFFGQLDGLYTSWYDNGQKKEEGKYKSSFNDGKVVVLNEKDGLWKGWSKNGKNIYEGVFQNGIEWDGTFHSSWDSSGTDQKKTLKDGKLITWTKTTWKNQQKEQEKNVNKDELPHGLWTFWYENGQKRSEGTYKDGKMEGLQTFWYKNGQRNREATYKDGELDGLTTEWHEDGQKKKEKIFVKGSIKSEKLYEQPTMYEEIIYDNPGSYNFVKTQYHKKGVVIDTVIIEKRNDEVWHQFFYFDDGKLDYIIKPGSDWKYSYYYSESGILLKEGALIKEAIYDGIWKWYHNNGQIKASGSFLNRYGSETYNKLVMEKNGYGKEGLWTFWYENGDKSQEITYSQNEHPYVITYYQNGKKASETITDANHLIGIDFWDKMGKKIVFTDLHDSSKEIVMLDMIKKESDKKSEGTQKFTSYYADGSIQAEFFIIDAINFNIFSPDTTIQLTGAIKEGKKDGKWIAYFADGEQKSIREYQENKKSGEWISYIQKKTKMEGGLYTLQTKIEKYEKYKKNVRLEKIDYKYYSNGNRLIEESFKYSYSLEDKVYKHTWHNNGNKHTVFNYAGQKLHGLWTIYHENGQKKQELKYNHGKIIDGEYFEWYDNGKKKSKGKYKSNLKNGKWISWDENGKKSKIKYKNGKKV